LNFNELCKNTIRHKLYSHTLQTTSQCSLQRIRKINVRIACFISSFTLILRIKQNNMQNSFIKTSSTHITTTVSEETGEIIEQKINKSTYLVNSKEEFYLMYSSMVLILKQSSDIKMKLFASLLERYSSGQEFAMNGSLKKLIAKETKCNPRSFDNAFTFLVKENIIVRLNSQLYKINPRHVFQGSSSTRNLELKAIIELGCRNC
jgi:hypothetical protein